MKKPIIEDSSSAILADDLRQCLRQLVRRLRQEDEHDGSGLPLQQKKVLNAIAGEPGIGVAALARREDVKGPTMSGQVKSLETAGLVQRTAPDPDDRRRTGLTLTAAGEALIAQLRQRRRDWLTNRISQLPHNGAETLRQAIVHLKEISK